MKALPKKSEVVTNDDLRSLCQLYSYDHLANHIEKHPPDIPFKSDGASVIPDNICDIDLYPAAFWHDVRYWCGTTGDEEGRLMADCQFCMDAMTMCGADANLAMKLFLGVRAGGGEHLPTPWRWGFGRK